MSIDAKRLAEGVKATAPLVETPKPRGKRRTQDEFVFAWEHEFFGLSLDLAMSRLSGAELALRAGMVRAKIKERLTQIYRELEP